ncbi:23S rRNA (adenine(2030)-N(6))-methyltransferase RlmJ [Defluviimonas sp. WL0002]|uniref:Ribosomal RNA large subunit methyltransferase J n=1 Tax=Albidovulum marisflavi TaxID=2984159 RepID=A0ABT2ZFC8_9RHOB|nr:23S rRNA (adenine(2030)-N(6))-methyltransferase RlmJ [Defluviimonas sp. WL0002]MCV2869837.1 23S rRNA (adenine(2030)-N(6))-methyltransferase RlmJ [Defluviimonas sp. WL0002]
MLSYQHIYHAGNLADVHKHALLAVMLDYLTRKDKPLSYLETHAGRGLYRLDAPEAQKTGEAEQGIGRLAAAFPPDHPYARILARVQADHGPSAYAGSPLVAALSLRAIDRMHLAELHPREHAALAEAMSPFGADIRHQDGVEMALALTPPEPRRGIMLIDPSYEVKTDYTSMARLVAQVARKWNVGVIALWYPILTSRAHEGMLATLESQDLPGALRHEVRFPPARDGHGMTGSGLFIVNAPFGTAEECARLDAIFAGLKH